MRVSGINNGQNFNNQPAFGVNYAPKVKKLFHQHMDELSLLSIQRVKELRLREDGLLLEEIGR